MPPKIDKSKKRLDILSAAIRVFSKKGFYKTSIQDIADEANVGKGTVYEYFQNKDSLFTHCFNAFFEENAKVLKTFETSDLKVYEKIHLMIEKLFNSFIEQADFFMLYFEYLLKSIAEKNDNNIFKDLSSIYIDFHKAIINLILESALKLKAEIDIEAFSSIVIAIADSIMLQYFINPDAIDMNKTSLTLKTMLKHCFEEK